MTFTRRVCYCVEFTICCPRILGCFFFMLLMVYKFNWFLLINLQKNKLKTCRNVDRRYRTSFLETSNEHFVCYLLI
jgi:hypothetical protein